jgi:predicted regulator of Ras-like GTPase activity (Roadblock/LC7/MglB family)
MTHPTLPTAHRRQDLKWLLEAFIDRVPGARQAMLASRDGMKLTWEGLSADDADQLAAVMSGLYSLGRGEVKATGGDVRQIVIEHDAGYLYVMSTSDQLPAEAGPGVVGSVLAVRTSLDADPGVVGHEMATLITGVAEHLVTPTRNTGLGQ